MRRLATVLAALLIFIAGAGTILALQWSLRGPAEGNTTAAYGDWRLDCPPKGQQAAHCQLVQNLVREGTGVTVTHLEVNPIAKMNQLTVIVPPGVMRESGVGFAIGTRPQQKIAYQTCDNTGCAALLPLDGPITDAMRQNTVGRITITDRDGSSVPLQFSLRGFSDGLAMLDRDTFLRSLGFAWLGL